MPNSHRPPDKKTRSCLCRVRRCELSRLDSPTSAFGVRVRPAVAPAVPAPPDTLRHTSSVHTATPDTTRRSCLCRVWCAGVNWTIALNVFRLQMFCRSATVLSCRESNFTPPKRTRHCRQDSFVVSGVAVCVSLNRPTFQHCSWLTSCRSPTVVVTTALG